MKRRAFYWQQGLSLVELMVGMVLGLFLVLGIGQVFVSNNNTFRTQEGMAKIQEGGRFAMQRISAAIRSAGFFGCSGVDEVNKFYVVADNPPDGLKSVTSDTPIIGEDDVSSGTTIDGKSLVVGSDTVTLRGSGMSGIAYTGVDLNPTQDIPIANGNISFLEADYVLISDCKVGTLFRVSKVNSGVIEHKAACDSGGTCNTSASLGKLYGGDATITHLYAHTFFVADSGRTNHQGDPVMSLYIQNHTGSTFELVEGVSQLQVLYGVDKNGDLQAEAYMDASEITAADNWDGVVSVQFSLLLDSVDDAVNTPTAYTFQGTSYTPTDRRLRKEFTALFTLRNRAL